MIEVNIKSLNAIERNNPWRRMDCVPEDNSSSYDVNLLIESNNGELFFGSATFYPLNRFERTDDGDQGTDIAWKYAYTLKEKMHEFTGDDDV